MPKALSNACERDVRIFEGLGDVIQYPLAILASGDSRASRQFPVGPNKVTRVAVRVTFEIILMLGLGLPEFAGWSNFRHHSAGPQT